MFSLKKIRKTAERLVRRSPRVIQTTAVRAWWAAPDAVTGIFFPTHKHSEQYIKTRHSAPLLQNAIFYECSQGAVAGDSPLALFRYLVDKPEYAGWTHVWSLADAAGTPLESDAKRANVVLVEPRSRQYFDYLARCRYLVNNTSFPPEFVKRSDQVYANTWHGTPLKRLGKHMTSPNKRSVFNVQRNFNSADMIVMPNKYTADIMIDAFDLSHTFSGRVLESGYPRTDFVHKSDRNELRRKLGVAENETLALYLPTWRGTKVSDATRGAVKTVSEIRQIQTALPDDIVLRARLHPFVASRVPDDIAEMMPASTIDTSELLAAADVLITDYSSVYFDFLATGRPILFYMYDHGTYARQRGLYLELSDLPGPVCATADELALRLADLPATLAEYKTQYDAAVQRFAYLDDGSCAERLAKALFGGPGTLDDKERTLPRDRKRVLFYPGNMAANGITFAAIALLNNLDFDKVDVTCVFYSAKTPPHIELLDPRIAKVFMTMVKPYGRGERLQNYDFAFSTPPRSMKILDGPYYPREVRRHFGDAAFDYVINFEGYNRYMAALLAAVPARRHAIYLHNDMYSESLVKHRQLGAIFKLYPRYDDLVAVTAASLEQNAVNLAPVLPDIRDRLVCAPNLLDVNRVVSGGGALVEHDKDAGKLRFETARDGESPVREQVPAGPEDAIRFVNIGRYSEEKNQRELIHAFRAVVDAHPNAALYVVGGYGPLRGALHRLVVEIGLEDNVFVTGPLRNPHALLSLAECLVLPSTYESMGLVVLEAFILGRPAIVSDIPGPRELVNEYGGVVLDGTDADSIARAINHVIEHGAPLPSFNPEEFNQENLGAFARLIEG